MRDFVETQEYQDRRQKDEALERQMRETLQKIYVVNGLNPVYNIEQNAPSDVKNPKAWVTDREKKGCDVEFRKGMPDAMIVDEKAYNSKQDAYQDANTYAFEVSTQNNKNGQGWLFKPDAINTHFALIYPQRDISGDIRKMEIIIISRDVLLSELDKVGISSREAVESYLEEHGSWGDDNRERAKVTEDIKITHTGESVLQESPTNIVISRDWLRAKADKVIDITDMELVKRQYQEKTAERSVNPKVITRPTQMRGIHFRKQSMDAFAKAGKTIPKLRGGKLPEFLPMDFGDMQPGTNVNLRIMEYAVSGKTVVLKGMPNKEVYDKPLCIICGPAQNISLNSLSFKELGFKQQFTFSGEICDKVGEKYITPEKTNEKQGLTETFAK